jgi:hypothetical protein
MPATLPEITFRIVTTRRQYRGGSERVFMTGDRRDDRFFWWSRELGCYVWQGKELTWDEYHAITPEDWDMIARIAAHGYPKPEAICHCRVDVIHRPVDRVAKTKKAASERAESKRTVERVAE